MSQLLSNVARRTGLVLAAAVVLTGCAGGIDPASMMQSPERGQGAALSVVPYPAAPRQVQIIDLTPETIGRYGGPGAASTVAGDSWIYRVGIGDVLQIHVVDAPELTLRAGYRVEPDGAIQVPFLGRVPVDGRGTAEIRADLTTRLQRYITQPQADVRVSDFNARHVAVVGEVRRPSRQTLTDLPLTVMDAINEAGGFDGEPARTRVVLIRAGVERDVDVSGFLTNGTPTPVLQDGDVLRVGGRRAMRRATATAATVARLHTGGSRMRVLDLSAGPVTLAQGAAALTPVPGSAVFVLRETGGAVQALRLGAQDAADMALGGRFHLQPGDLVTVDPSPSVDPTRQVAHLNAALRALTRN